MRRRDKHGERRAASCLLKPVEGTGNAGDKCLLGRRRQTFESFTVRNCSWQRGNRKQIQIPDETTVRGMPTRLAELRVIKSQIEFGGLIQRGVPDPTHPFTGFF